MRKTIQIAAATLLVLLTALAVATLQVYRNAREHSRVLYERGLNQRDFKIRDSLRNASDALLNLQIYAANYVLTGQADALKTYNESREDWQYESESLELASGNDARGPLLHEFLDTGRQLASELSAIVSLYSAGSRDAALDHLRGGSVMAERAKINKMSEAGQKVFGRESYNSYNSNLKVTHRLLYCAGGLYLLGCFGFVLMFFLLRLTRSSDGGMIG